MKLKTLIISIAAAVLAVGGFSVGAAIYNSPQNVTKNAILGVFNDFTKRDELSPILNMTQKGSLELSVSEVTKDGVNTGETFEVEGKVYFSKDSVMLSDLALELGEVKLGGSAYISSNEIYIEETELFDRSIGIVKGEIADDFEDSVFAYGSGSKYAIGDKESYDELVKMLEFIDEVDREQTTKDAGKVAAKYLGEIWKIFSKHAEFESETDDVRFEDGRKSVRVITVIIDEKAMSKIVRDICEFLADDEDMIEFLEKHEDDLLYLGDKYLDPDSDSLSDAYEDAIEELEDNIDDICDSIEKFKTDVKLEIVTPKLSSKLLRFTINVDKYDVFSIDFGSKGLAKTDRIAIEIDEDEAFVYEIVKNSSKKKLKISVDIYGEEVLELEIDRKNEKYSLSVPERLEIEGDIVTKSGKTTITFDEITVYNYEYDPMYDLYIYAPTVYETDLTVIIDEKDKMPKPAKDFDRISDIDESDIEDWIDSLEEIY